MALTDLARFCGVWEGTGRGYFPTVQPFRYRERLALTLDAPRELVQLELRAWKQYEGSDLVEASHHEVGAIIATANGFELSTIQNGSRYERLVGTLVRTGEDLVLSWVSAEYANDPRLVSAERTWRLVGDRLHYTMGMHTTTVARMEPHLEAELVREA
jgi:hypothetical protein